MWNGAVVTADAVVIGSGPNGLAAATRLARAGWAVEVLERRDVAGGAIGSLRTDRGYLHDWGSAFYGVLHATPVFAELGLDRRVSWARTDTPVAALWQSGRDAAVMQSAVGDTAAGLGADAGAWLELVAWWERTGKRMFAMMLGPIGAPVPLARFLATVGPRELIATARTLLEPVQDWAGVHFAADPARMLLAGHASHADVAVDVAGSTPAALLLAMAAQEHGMPVPVGGAQSLAEGMVEAAEEAGVIVRTGCDVRQVVVRRGRAVAVVCADGTEVTARRAVVADVAPHVLARDLVGEEHLPGAWLQQLRRHRYGSGYFRLDLDLSAPAPWADERVREAMVVHVTDDLDGLAEAQGQTRRGRLPHAPQLIVGQQDRADPTRVPAGAASLWVECHCPATPRAAGSGWEQRFADLMTERLEAHAPGLTDLVVDRTVTPPLALQERDPNLIGGDVGGGSATVDQLVVFRPVAGWSSYALPVGGLYMCGAASHPGGGVHGMGGRNAAGTVLRDARLGWDRLRSRAAR